jgi:hypothetical protein
MIYCLIINIISQLKPGLDGTKRITVIECLIRAPAPYNGDACCSYFHDTNNMHIYILIGLNNHEF